MYTRDMRWSEYSNSRHYLRMISLELPTSGHFSQHRRPCRDSWCYKASSHNAVFLNYPSYQIVSENWYESTFYRRYHLSLDSRFSVTWIRYHFARQHRSVSGGDNSQMTIPYGEQCVNSILDKNVQNVDGDCLLWIESAWEHQDDNTSYKEPVESRSKNHPYP